MTANRAIPIAALLGLVALLGVGVWLLYRTPGTLVNEPPPRLGPTAQPGGELVVVEIDEGDSATAISEKLERAGVIESARLFRVLAALLGVGDHLAPGSYEFQRGEPAITVVRRISQGITASLIVTIPEGLRAAEIGALLEGSGVISAQDFQAALGDQYQASFLGQAPPGAGLEGFLFPATYGFARGATAHDVIQQLLDAFDQRYQDELQPLLPTPDGRSLYQVVTLASIIDREAQFDEDRPLIASVYLNRLKAGIPLQADPTVQYALAANPGSVSQFGFWKRELSLTDLMLDSPYNTYQNPGLPPGPIANPGLQSLLAAAQPAQTNYLFFVAGPDGRHVFAATLQEHQQNVCRFEPDRPDC
jgi:UPF0755 protein